MLTIENLVVAVIAAFFQSLSVVVIIFKQMGLSRNKKRMQFFLFNFFYCLISSLFISNEFRFLSFLIIITLLLYFLLNIKSTKVILYSFIFFVILSVSEILVSLFMVGIGLDSISLVSDIFWNSIATILISLFSILLISIPAIFNSIKGIISLFERKKELIKYLFVFLIVIYLIIFKNGLEFLLKSNYYINILFIVGIILIITMVIKNELKSEQLQEMNKQMLNYVKKYEKIITEQGKANHEFKNQLMVIKGYAQMKSPKLLEYLDSITEDQNKTHSSYLISQLNKFPDGGIKGLLYYKLSIMDDFKINYQILVGDGVKNKLNSLSTNSYKNITKVLGVLLDNAIEASKESKEKKIIISVIKEKSVVIFNISNTYKGKINLNKIGTGYTTKGKGHGYGLRLVEDIINQNKSFEIKRSLEDNYLSSELRISIRKNKKTLKK